MEHATVLRIKDRQHLVIDRVERAIDFPQRALAALGDLDDAAAAVGAIAAANDQLVILELLERG